MSELYINEQIAVRVTEKHLILMLEIAPGTGTWLSTGLDEIAIGRLQAAIEEFVNLYNNAQIVTVSEDQKENLLMSKYIELERIAKGRATSGD